MWFSPFVDWWLEWPNPLVRDRLSRSPADMDQRGSAAELLVDQGLWVKGFVDKTLCRHLDTQCCNIDLLLSHCNTRENINAIGIAFR
jgi:hypothetical protein